MRLLVVEDDRLLNDTLCYNLSEAGYTGFMDILVNKDDLNLKEFIMRLHNNLINISDNDFYVIFMIILK